MRTELTNDLVQLDDDLPRPLRVVFIYLNKPIQQIMALPDKRDNLGFPRVHGRIPPYECIRARKLSMFPTFANRTRALPDGSVVTDAPGDDLGWNPDWFDLARDASEHLAFGFGAHFCLGAQLARLEAKVGLEELFASCPPFAIDEQRVQRISSVLLRGIKHLPIRFAA